MLAARKLVPPQRHERFLDEQRPRVVTGPSQGLVEKKLRPDERVASELGRKALTGRVQLIVVSCDWKQIEARRPITVTTMLARLDRG